MKFTLRAPGAPGHPALDAHLRQGPVPPLPVLGRVRPGFVFKDFRT